MSVSYASNRPPHTTRHDEDRDDHDLSGHYSPYSNPDSPDEVEDENASLRSQALNSDGTPKRPMNAFMIFARRRRPQVSAANQMMRTGEISKILSKEWNTMPMSDKQFYLDQAKKLKENFNSKYPDYVYRRRPNNSRKKRRSDLAPYEPSLSPHDYADEYGHGGSGGPGSVSPIDAHHPHAHALGPAYHARGLTYSASFPADAHTPSYYPSRHHHAYDSPVTTTGPYSTSLYHDDPQVWAGAASAPTLPLPSTKFLDGPHQSHSNTHTHSSPQHHHFNGIPKLDAAFPTPKLDSLSGTGGGPGGLLPHSGKLGPPAFSSTNKFADPWGAPHYSHHDTLRLSARRGNMNPAPLPLHGSASAGQGHNRHWSDSTTSASSVSPPSSAGSGAFPPNVHGANGVGVGNNGNAFAALTAPFAYPGSSASPAGSSSSGGSYYQESARPGTGHSVSAGAGGTSTGTGSTNGTSTATTYPNGTLALSPVNLWGSRSKGEL